MPMFFYALFNLPVGFGIKFPGQAEPAGQLLKGDLDMPATNMPSWPRFANAIRNVVLANLVWRTYSLIKVQRFDPEIPFHLAFGGSGAWMVIPQPLTGTYIAVKHGREDCVFAAISVLGDDIAYTVIARGSRMDILRACLADIQIFVASARKIEFEQVYGYITFV